jgi:sec-independent protein translocase protein TatA
MGLGPVHLIVLAIVAILLLGGGRFSNMMGDVAKGVKNFKKGMAEEEETLREPSRIDRKVGEPVIEVESEKLREER